MRIVLAIQRRREECSSYVVAKGGLKRPPCDRDDRIGESELGVESARLGMRSG